MKLPAIIFYLLFVCNTVAAQQFYFRHYKVENGLSNNSVICSMQDSRGFMWFGTKDGLNRFDGYQFKIFRYNPDDSTSLKNNFILSMAEDKTSEIWVGTYKGLFHYTAKNEVFHLVPGTDDNEIRDIQIDKDNNIWFVSGSVLCRYDSKTRKVVTYNENTNLHYTTVCTDTKGNIYATTEDGYLSLYNSINNKIITTDIFPAQYGQKNKWIEEMLIISDSTALIGTSNSGIKLYHFSSRQLTDIRLNNEDGTGIFVRDIIRRSADEFWVATETGIYIYNSKTGYVVNLKSIKENPFTLSDNAIYTLFKDNEGGIWAGTYFGGINYYSQNFNVFEKFFPGDNHSISGNAVREICKDKFGNIWIGTEDAGLNKLNSSGKFTWYQHTSSKQSIAYSNIHGLAAVGNELWIGTFEHGLDVMDITSGKVIRHYEESNKPHSLKNNFIHSIYLLKNGTILIGTPRGVYSYNKTADNFDLISEVPEFIFFTNIFEDSRGNIWLGTYRNGLYFFNPSLKTKGHFEYDENNPSSIVSNRINKIFEDSKNNIWLATESGLSKYVATQNKFINYTIRNGMPGNIIYSLEEDNNKNLWVSTSKGLVCMQPETGKLLTYTKVNGLLTDQFNYNSSFKDEAGRLYFGSVNGMIRFSPSKFITQNESPKVLISGFQINNTEVIAKQTGSPLQQSISFTKDIVLKYNQSTFSIDFAALSYTAPEMTEYAYKMDGLDNDWTYLKSNRKVYFTNLAPGNYKFHIKAAINGSKWRDNETILSIAIHPPFWASKWAYLLYAFLLLVILFVFIKSYHKRTERKTARQLEMHEHEKEKEIYHSKIEFFTNIAHEIRTPLTLISLPLEKAMYLAKNDSPIKDNLLLMEKNTKRLIDLTNQLLDFRKTEANNFSLSFVKTNVSDLLQEMYEQFKPLAEQKNIEFTVQIPSIPLYAFIDPEAFNKIVANLMNNAVKYAAAKVSVRLMPFNSEDTEFSVEIKNDGFLIPPELKEKIFEPFFRINATDKETGTGIGLPLSRSLATLHHGSLSLQQHENTLNTFLLQLPLHQEKEFILYGEKRPDENNDVVENEVQVDSSLPVILLVDDNKEIINFIAAELRDQYNILKAYDGAGAIKILEDKIVHLVVSDVMMPVVDGFELCSHIKGNINSSHIPVILLTAKTTLQSKIQGLELGADAYIEKPFSQQHLQAQIASLLNNRNKIITHFTHSPVVHLKTIAHTKADETFLDALQDAINTNIDNPDFDADQLAKAINMSRASFYRKIKVILNLSPTELILVTRLKRAAVLLAENKDKISTVAMMVGYNHQSNFTRDFHKHFGVNPSEYNAKKI